MYNSMLPSNVNCPHSWVMGPEFSYNCCIFYQGFLLLSLLEEIGILSILTPSRFSWPPIPYEWGGANQWGSFCPGSHCLCDLSRTCPRMSHSPPPRIHTSTQSPSCPGTLHRSHMERWDFSDGAFHHFRSSLLNTQPSTQNSSNSNIRAASCICEKCFMMC
jgi:hypothetical protein